jgi:hypothetical protein
MTVSLEQLPNRISQCVDLVNQWPRVQARQPEENACIDHPPLALEDPGKGGTAGCGRVKALCYPNANEERRNGSSITAFPFGSLKRGSDEADAQLNANGSK